MREIAASPHPATATSVRPSITIKIAQTLDGRIATSTGQSQWITCEPARALAHELRATHDAVLVGIGTVLHDNPRLTVRLVDGPDPLRVVVDSRLRIPLDSALLTEQPDRTIVVTSEEASPERVATVRALGARVIFGQRGPDGLDLVDMLGRLRELGIRSLMVEGGSGIGLDAVGDLGIRDLGNALTFRETTIRQLGPDIVFDGIVDRPGGSGPGVASEATNRLP